MLVYTLLILSYRGVVMQVKVSQWGNSKAIRLSKDMSEFLSVESGCFIEVEYVDKGLLFRASEPTVPEYNLDELLAGSPAGSFDLTDEDRAWLDVASAGNEFK